MATDGELARQGIPGVTLGIDMPGCTWISAAGLADRATGRAMSPTDGFRIASITKTFTATLILRLVDKGAISLDDHLAKYVKGIDNGQQITIRQMLNMTSGIFSYTEDEQFGKDFDANPVEPFPPSKAIAIIKAHDPDFAPGTSWHYSDSNYLLLGVIAEKVTGRPIDRLMQDLVIEPLGLSHTSYPTTPAIPGPHPVGYVAQQEAASVTSPRSTRPSRRERARSSRPWTTSPPTPWRWPTGPSCPRRRSGSGCRSSTCRSARS